MSNNDKFIRDTPHGKLMESIDQYSCIKCNHYKVENCKKNTNYMCHEDSNYYFSKEEVNEDDSITDFLIAKAKKHEITFPDIPKLKDIIQEYLKYQNDKNSNH